MRGEPDAPAGCLATDGQIPVDIRRIDWHIQQPGESTMKSVLHITAAIVVTASLGHAMATSPDLAALRDGGHWKRIRTIVEPRLRSNPGDLEAGYWMARAKVAFGDPQAAYDLAKMLVAANPQNADYQFALAESAGMLGKKVGVFKAYSYAREFKRAGEAAIALDPRHTEALGMLVSFYYDAPGILGGDQARGGQLLKTLASVSPVLGCLFEASRALSAKDRPKAEAMFLKAVEVDPASYAAHVRLASFYITPDSRKYQEAVNLAARARTIDPARSAAYPVLAVAHAELEQWNDLDSVLAQVEANVTDNLSAHYAAGRVLVTKGRDLPRAERYFRKYLTQDPEAGAVDHAGAHWRLGQVLEKSGRKAEAVTEIETALRLRPDFDGAKEDLKRLK
jgi:tetratricopeptide (TPR) repeat protein